MNRAVVTWEGNSWSLSFVYFDSENKRNNVFARRKCRQIRADDKVLTFSRRTSKSKAKNKLFFVHFLQETTSAPAGGRQHWFRIQFFFWQNLTSSSPRLLSSSTDGSLHQNRRRRRRRASKRIGKASAEEIGANEQQERERDRRERENVRVVVDVVTPAHVYTERELNWEREREKRSCVKREREKRSCVKEREREIWIVCLRSSF